VTKFDSTSFEEMCKNCVIIDFVKDCSEMETKMSMPYMSEFKEIDQRPTLTKVQGKIIRNKNVFRRKDQQILKEVPSRGVYKYLTIRYKSRKLSQSKRNNEIDEYFRKLSSVVLDEEEIILATDLSDWRRLEQKLQNLLEISRTVIVMAPDNFPSLVKKYDKVLNVWIADHRSLIFPDIQTFNTLKYRHNNTISTIMGDATDEEMPVIPPVTTRTEPGNELPEWVSYVVMGVVILLLLVLMYYLWPYVVDAFTFPGNWTIGALSEVSVTSVAPSWWQSMLGQAAEGTFQLITPIWVKVLAWFTNMLWWISLGSLTFMFVRWTFATTPRRT
jgi:hypothetical protein